MAQFNPKPATLEELLLNVREFDGEIVSVLPQFDDVDGERKLIGAYIRLRSLVAQGKTALFLIENGVWTWKADTPCEASWR